MTDSVIVALVTGAFSLIVALITSRNGYNKIHVELEKHNVQQDERIKQLKESVDKHNSFAERIPKLEQMIADLKERVGRLENR